MFTSPHLARYFARPADLGARRPPRPRSPSRLAAYAVACLAMAWASHSTAAGPAACGAVKTFERCDAHQRCEQRAAYDVPDYWHGLAQCMRSLRDIWSRQGPDASVDLGRSRTSVSALVRSQVTREMATDHVRFLGAGGQPGRRFGEVFDDDGSPRQGFDRVVLLNDRNVPYNAMGQSGLAYFLYQIASLADRGGYPEAKTDAKLYRALARGAILTVITPMTGGGLASSRPCGANGELRCTWYHSITRRDQAAESGATLNQDLHAIRDLGQIADLLRKLRWDEGIDFNRSIIEGLNQLAFSEGSRRPGTVPNLADFLAPPTGKARVRWAYYGLNPSAADGQRAYFLGFGGKDCSYHLHVLDLMSQILQRAEAQSYLSRYEASLLACDSPLGEMQRAARLRKSAAAQPTLWSTPAPGRDYSCPKLQGNDSSRSDDDDNDAFLDKRLSACPTTR